MKNVDDHAPAHHQSIPMLFAGKIIFIRQVTALGHRRPFLFGPEHHLSAADVHRFLRASAPEAALPGFPTTVGRTFRPRAICSGAEVEAVHGPGMNQETAVHFPHLAEEDYAASEETEPRDGGPLSEAMVVQYFINRIMMSRLIELQLRTHPIWRKLLETETSSLRR